MCSCWWPVNTLHPSQSSSGGGAPQSCPFSRAPRRFHVVSALFPGASHCSREHRRDLSHVGSEQSEGKVCDQARG